MSRITGCSWASTPTKHENHLNEDLRYQIACSWGRSSGRCGSEERTDSGTVCCSTGNCGWWAWSAWWSCDAWDWRHGLTPCRTTCSGRTCCCLPGWCSSQGNPWPDIHLKWQKLMHHWTKFFDTKHYIRNTGSNQQFDGQACGIEAQVLIRERLILKQE